MFKGEKNRLRSKEDTSKREPEKKGDNQFVNETMLDKCSNNKQNVDKTMLISFMKGRG